MGGSSFQEPSIPANQEAPTYSARRISKAARAARLRAQAMFGGNRLFLWGTPPGASPGGAPGGGAGVSPGSPPAIVSGESRRISFLGNPGGA